VLGGLPGNAQPFAVNLLHVVGWWIVPGSPSAVLSFMEAHRPSGAERWFGPFVGGAVGYPASGYVGLRWGLVPHVTHDRALEVTAERLADGSTGLRADAYAVWMIPTPATEQIPMGADLLRVRATTITRFGGKIVSSRVERFAVRSRTRIGKAVAALNALSVPQPFFCSCGPGVIVGGPPTIERSLADVRLVFYAPRRSRPLAVADVDLADGEVLMTIEGRTEPVLATVLPTELSDPIPRSLVAQLDSALRVKLERSPKTRPPDDL
jgi:hypothetical protein